MFSHVVLCWACLETLEKLCREVQLSKCKYKLVQVKWCGRHHWGWPELEFWFTAWTRNTNYMHPMHPQVSTLIYGQSNSPSRAPSIRKKSNSLSTAASQSKSLQILTNGCIFSHFCSSHCNVIIPRYGIWDRGSYQTERFGGF